jgi:uncharacterized protein YqjF (DUF2071 family)
VLGCRIPCHADFEELNLRFYVRRHGPEGWRRGVVFIKEIVPRRAVTLVARKIYGENYVTMPMGHEITKSLVDGTYSHSISYTWRPAGGPNWLRMETATELQLPAEGSLDQFIAEHYWGYTRLSDGRGLEYRVDHLPWRVAPAQSLSLHCDAEQLYGASLAEHLTKSPISAFLVDGSTLSLEAVGEITFNRQAPSRTLVHTQFHDLFTCHVKCPIRVHPAAAVLAVAILDAHQLAFSLRGRHRLVPARDREFVGGCVDLTEDEFLRSRRVK